MAGALILGADYRIILWDRNIQVYRFVGLFGYNVEHPEICIMVLHLAYWYGDLHKDMHTLGGCVQRGREKGGARRTWCYGDS